MSIVIDPMVTRRMASAGQRLDGRSGEQYRAITVEKDFVKSAEGSARVRIGGTEVIVGVKIDVGTPFSDRPNEGVLMVNCEFVTFASPEFEPGPPSNESIEVARVVDRTIRESKILDLDALCITPGEKVWMVNVDIDVIDNDGNLIDAAALATMAALGSAVFPTLGEDGRVAYDKPKTQTPLPLKGTAVATTFIKLGDAIVADPTETELAAMDARLTIGTFSDGRETKLCAMQKGGPAGLTIDEIDAIIGRAIAKGDELRKMI